MTEAGKRPRSGGSQKRTKLSPRELKFAHAYVRNFGNAAKASLESGYNPWGGRDLLKRPHVVAKIRELRETLEVKYEITTERVLQEMAKLAFANLDAFTDIDENGDIRITFDKSGPADRAAISELTSDVYYEGKGDAARPVLKTKVKLHPKAQALEMLGRFLRLFGDRDQEAETAETMASKVRETMKAMKEADGV